MKLKEYHEFKINQNYITALTNGDFTGLNDEEIEQITVIEEVLNRLNGGHWIIDILDEQPHFTLCKMRNLYSNLVDVEVNYFV